MKITFQFMEHRCIIKHNTETSAVTDNISGSLDENRFLSGAAFYF